MMGPGGQSMMHGISGGGPDVVLIVGIVAAAVLMAIGTLLTVRARKRQPQLAGAADQLLVSDQAREAVVTALTAAYGSGYLTHEELEARASQALSARTRADLHHLTRDIPPRP